MLRKSLLGRPGEGREASWGGPGVFVGVRGVSWGSLGQTWDDLGASWEGLGRAWHDKNDKSRNTTRISLEHHVFFRPGEVREATWVVLGKSVGVRGSSWEGLGRSWHGSNKHSNRKATNRETPLGLGCSSVPWAVQGGTGRRFGWSWEVRGASWECVGRIPQEFEGFRLYLDEARNTTKF